MAERGPFDKYLSPWDLMRPNTNIENRENDFPWVALNREVQPEPGSYTTQAMIDWITALRPPEIPPMTALSRDAGARDIGPLSKEDVLKFLIDVDSHNPDPPMRRK